MIIVKVDKGIEKALKKYKSKYRKTKVGEELRKRKEFTKKSVKKRQQKLKAIYIQEKYGNNE
jgi:small subunit ribosomal protein S21